MGLLFILLFFSRKNGFTGYVHFSLKHSISSAPTSPHSQIALTHRYIVRAREENASKKLKIRLTSVLINLRAGETDALIQIRQNYHPGANIQTHQTSTSSKFEIHERIYPVEPLARFIFDHDCDNSLPGGRDSKVRNHDYSIHSYGSEQ